MMGNKEILPFTDWRQNVLDKTLAHILRHDKDAPFDDAGRVPVAYIMTKLGNRRDDLRFMERHEMIATAVLNHRFCFFGPVHDDLMRCSHISAAQGHTTTKVNLDVAMTELKKHQIPADVVHLTQYWCLNSILEKGLLRGGGDAKNNRPINCHPVGHRDPNLNPGSRDRSQVAIYLDTDKIREDVPQGLIKVYKTASDHLAFSKNIPVEYISHAVDTYTDVTVFSKWVGMKRKAQAQIGPEPPTASRTAGGPHQPVRGNLRPGGAAEDLEYERVVDEPVMGNKCPRCEAQYSAGVMFCLDMRCCYPLTKEAFDTLQSTIKVRPGEKNKFLEMIGYQLHKSPYKHGKKLGSRDAKKRIKQAKSLGFKGHAHRYDSSLVFQQQAVNSGVPRELEIEDADPKTGIKTGRPYFAEKEYLDANPWEESEVFKILLASRGSNRAAATDFPFENRPPKK